MPRSSLFSRSLQNSAFFIGRGGLSDLSSFVRARLKAKTCIGVRHLRALDVTSIVKIVERDDARFFWFLGQWVDGWTARQGIMTVTREATVFRLRVPKRRDRLDGCPA